MWKITKDLITSEDEVKEGRTWANRHSMSWDEKRAEVIEMHEFRLVDGDDIVYLEGESSNPNAFEPLDFFAPLLGVVGIEYKNKTTGEWELL